MFLVGCVFRSDLFQSDVDFSLIGFRSDRLLVGSDFGRIDVWSDVFRSDRRGRIDAGRSVIDPCLASPMPDKQRQLPTEQGRMKLFIPTE